MTMSSTDKRYGHPAPNIPTSCSCWRARHHGIMSPNAWKNCRSFCSIREGWWQWPRHPPERRNGQPFHYRDRSEDAAGSGRNHIGEKGQGLRYILTGMNTERIVFDRPIRRNQGVQVPIARPYAHTEAAALMVEKAARNFDGGHSIGPPADMARLLADNALWEAACMCLQTQGGFGFIRPRLSSPI